MDKKAEERGAIVYYCKDCEEIVDTNKVPGRFVYKCKKCGTKNVAFGTEKSIRGFFRIEDEVPEESEIKKEIAVKKEVKEGAKQSSETEAAQKSEAKEPEAKNEDSNLEKKSIPSEKK